MRAALVALAAAAVFGGADQYAGSFATHPVATDVSLLSAPWLLLAFLAGCTQRDARRAALLGLGCTFAALAGYALMTLSPLEGAQLTLRTARGFATSEAPVLVGGVVTGPLFGLLGSRWRNDRAWSGAVTAAAVLCLEPLARAAAGREIRFRSVWVAEVVAGFAVAAYAVVAARVSGARARRG